MTSPAVPASCRPGAAAEDFHPLEVIAFFRRWPAGPFRDVLYTFIWNCGLGTLFWLVGGMFRPLSLNLHAFVSALLFANSIGFTLHAIFLVTGGLGLDRRVRRLGVLATGIYYTVLCTLGVVIGVMLVMAGHGAAFQWLAHPRWLASMAFTSALISVVIGAILLARERQAHAEAELARERARIERAEREAAAANLRALQAQIEPHFLFNTLANVASLVDADPAQARRMLESFNRFLRSSLAATRAAATTLGAEAELIGAYLEVLQVRMGARLRYRIDVPAELAGFALPPMLLQPIVENAIRHGIEPKVEGGEVAMRAWRTADGIRVEVADTGVGFAAATAGGLGLTNVRDRLRLLHGDRASIAVAENAPSGTRVTLELPA